MTKEQIIKVAESLGLVYGGDNEEGQPEFVGSDKQWEEFNKIDTSEIIEEPDFSGVSEDR
jgi:hypothetical protein